MGLFLRGLQCLDDDLIPRYFPARRRLVDGGEQGIRDTDLDRGRRFAVPEGSARAWTLAAVLLAQLFLLSFDRKICKKNRVNF